MFLVPTILFSAILSQNSYLFLIFHDNIIDLYGVRLTYDTEKVTQKRKVNFGKWLFFIGICNAIALEKKMPRMHLDKR